MRDSERHSGDFSCEESEKFFVLALDTDLPDGRHAIIGWVGELQLSASMLVRNRGDKDAPSRGCFVLAPLLVSVNAIQFGFGVRRGQ